MIKILPKLIITMMIVVLAISSIGPFSSCKKKEGLIPADTIKTIAKDFNLKTLTGDSLGLTDMNNKIVVLFFFGYSCSYCKTSAPEIQDNLVTPYASRTDYVVAGLDMWDGATAAVEAFKTSTGLSIPLLLKASGVAAEYGTTNDRLIIVDKMGYIRFKGNQSAIKDIDAVKMKINELLAN